jgi:hypothetical protein
MYHYIGHEIGLIVISTLVSAMTQCLSTFESYEMDKKAILGNTSMSGMALGLEFP